MLTLQTLKYFRGCGWKAITATARGWNLAETGKSAQRIWGSLRATGLKVFDN